MTAITLNLNFNLAVLSQYVTEASAMVLGEDTGGEDSCAALEVRERRRERVQSSRKHL